MTNWAELYEERRPEIDKNLTWWDDETPISESDLQEIAYSLHDLQREMSEYVDSELKETEPEMVAACTRDMNKVARRLVDRYTEDQIAFAIDYLTGKYD